jgi:putative acetyltransferase
MRGDGQELELMNAITLLSGNIRDIPTLQQLFVDTITTVCHKDYTPEQIEVWAVGAQNQERWETILRDQFVQIAEIENTMVGFATLDNGSYIDMLYVHKDFQGKGIAKKLYLALEKEALRSGQTELTTQASITAKPFFERMGFKVVREQKVERDGIALKNYIMQRALQNTV